MIFSSINYFDVEVPFNLKTKLKNNYITLSILFCYDKYKDDNPYRKMTATIYNFFFSKKTFLNRKSER